MLRSWKKKVGEKYETALTGLRICSARRKKCKRNCIVWGNSDINDCYPKTKIIFWEHQEDGLSWTKTWSPSSMKDACHELRNEPRSPKGPCGSVVEHGNAESEGLRFDSSWELNVYLFVPHASHILHVVDATRADTKCLLKCSSITFSSRARHKRQMTFMLLPDF